MVNHANCKLGRQPARFDSRVPEFSRYLKAALPAAPASTNWRAAVSEWNMLANDTLGDCTAASKCHAIQLWTANASKEARLTDADAIKFYSQTTGYDPNDPSTDQGGVMLDVLSWWLKHDLSGHKIDAFAALDFNSRANLRDAVWLCGLADIGVNLPIAAQTQDDWVLTSDGLKGDGEPRSWGGHDCTIVDYDENWCYIATWGIIKRASWDWIHAYTEEAYAILSREWLKSTGKTPSGFDYDTLIQDMEAFTPDPISKIQEATPDDDPVLLDLTWKDITISLHEASATWVLGLISTALAAYGQFDTSYVSTWLGVTGALFATWAHLTRVHSMNVSTKQLVEVAAEVIDILMRKRAR